LILFIFVNTANLLRMKMKMNIVVEFSPVDKIDMQRFCLIELLSSVDLLCATGQLLNDSK